MFSTILALTLACFFLQLSHMADAGIYVLKPEAKSTCHGGQKCTIQWLDDGNRPLLAAAGVCTFGLYTGTMQLVQAIPPADVSTTHSISFMPNPAAGPNSDSYYIGIISTTSKENISDPFSLPYKAFSPFFAIDQMTGSFDNPLPEATSTIPIPSSVFSHSATHLSTITVGTLLTSLPPLPTVPATTSTTSILSQTMLATKLSSSSISTPLVSKVASPALPVTTSSNDTLARGPPTLALTVAALLLFPLLLSIF